MTREVLGFQRPSHSSKGRFVCLEHVQEEQLLGDVASERRGDDSNMAMENHRKIIGKWWFNGDSMGKP